MTHQLSASPPDLVGPGIRTSSRAAAALWCAAVLALTSAVTAPVWVTAFVGIVVALVAFFTLREQLGQRGQGLLVAAATAGLLSVPAAVVLSLLVGTGLTDGLMDLAADEESGDSGSTGGGSTGGSGGQPTQSPTQTPTPRWVVLTPAAVDASDHAEESRDSLGQVVTFLPENAVDGVLDTAWRVPGDGVGDWIQLGWAAPVTVAKVGLVPGYAKVDADGTDRFTQNRRVAAFELLSDTGTSLGTWEPADDRGMQYASLEAPVSTSWLTVRIVSTTDPGDRDFTPISEIQVLGRR